MASCKRRVWNILPNDLENFLMTVSSVEGTGQDRQASFFSQIKTKPKVQNESVRHRFGAGMRMLEKYGVSARELRVVGGGSKNRLWRRIIADAFQLPLRFPAEPESAALGGALQAAAVCAGVPVADYVAQNEPPCEAEVRLWHPSLIPSAVLLWACGLDRFFHTTFSPETCRVQRCVAFKFSIWIEAQNVLLEEGVA